MRQIINLNRMWAFTKQATDVKWVYSADNTLSMPYKDNLQALIHEPSFRFALDANTWGKLPFIIKLGNLSVHTERSISAGDALVSMKALFEFIQWIESNTGTMR